jgi:hypothetical protein
VAVDVTAEGAVDELKGELVRRRIQQPDDEGGGEEPAQPDGVLLLGGEDLVLLVELVALQLHPLFVAAERVLELLQSAQPELALAVELGTVGGAIGDLDQAERVAVVVGLPVAVAVGRLLLVGKEGEGSFRPVAERPEHAALGVAVVAFAEERGGFGKPAAPVDQRQPPGLRVDLEEVVGRLRVGDREDDHHADQKGDDEGGAAERRADERPGDPGGDQGEDPDEDPGQRLAQEALEVEATEIVGVVDRLCRRRLCVRRPRHGRNLPRRRGCKRGCKGGSCCKVGESGLLWRSS